MSHFNEREKALLRARRHQLKDELKNCTAERAEQIHTRLATIQSWYHQQGETPAPAFMTKEEFVKTLRENGAEDTSKPKATIKLESTRDVDRLWPGLATANVLIDAPPKVKQYIREKMATLHG